MKNKFFLLLITLLIGVLPVFTACEFSCKETACSGVKSCSYCVDCAGKESVACVLEGFACYNDATSCINLYSCICGKDTFNTTCVMCPIQLAEETRNCNADCSLNDCAREDLIYTSITGDNFKYYDDKVDYKYVKTAKNFYRAEVSLKIETKEAWAYTYCTLIIENDGGQKAQREFYLGNMKPGVSKQINATFTFIGKSTDTYISYVRLSGVKPENSQK